MHRNEPIIFNSETITLLQFTVDHERLTCQFRCDYKTLSAHVELNCAGKVLITPLELIFEEKLALFWHLQVDPEYVHSVDCDH